MARRALVIGINCYHGETPFGEISSLSNPVRDAEDIAMLLSHHHDEDDNFRVESYLVDDYKQELTTIALYDSIARLFEGVCESVIFYFAGHGIRDPFTQQDYLVTTDGTFPHYGVPLDYIVKLANDAFPRIHSTTIILDCCHSGALAEKSIVGKGVTILSACGENQQAWDGREGENSPFTKILIDGLKGQAGDIFGRITVASLYNLVDQRLSSDQQRPVYKTNFSEFVVLRRTKGRLGRKKIRALLEHFPAEDFVHPLGPECEPESDRGHLRKHPSVKESLFDHGQHQIYRSMQMGFHENLIESHVPTGRPKLWGENWPPNSEEMFSLWHAAMYSTGCQLTSFGQHFWRLNQEGIL